MIHILTLSTIGALLLSFIVILYVSFDRDQRVLKYSRKPGRRIWYKVITFHPLTLPIIIFMIISTFIGITLLRDVNILMPDNTSEIIEISGIIIGIYAAIVVFWIMRMHSKVKVMSSRKYNRTFSKVYKSNENLYEINNLKYYARCKITTLQIQLYSPERLTTRMVIEAREIFKDKFIVKNINPKHLKKARMKSLKVAKKHRKAELKIERKSSY